MDGEYKHTDEAIVHVWWKTCSKMSLRECLSAAITITYGSKQLLWKRRPERRSIILYLMDPHSHDERINTWERGFFKREKGERKREGERCVYSIYEDRVNIYPVRFLKCPDLQWPLYCPGRISIVARPSRGAACVHTGSRACTSSFALSALFCPNGAHLARKTV